MQSSKDTAKMNQFRDECTLSNRLIFRIILLLALAMECLMLFIYIVSPYFVRSATFYPQYIYLYVTMIAVSPVLLILFRIFRDRTAVLQWLEFYTLLFLNVWSAVFSACDVINGFSSYLFIQFLIVNSLAVRMPPFGHCSANILSFAVYVIFISFSGLSIVRLFAEIINPFFMAAASCIIIVVNDRMRFHAFLNKKLVIEQHKKLEFYANNDFLTKIPNRKSIIENLEEIIVSEKSPVACLMVDIDFFKLYNDTYGHIAGDNCLIRLTSVLERMIKNKGGSIGRYGGEEFLVVFAEKSRQEILNTAEELLEAVRRENIEFPQSAVLPEVTISIGVYVSSNTNEDQDSLIRNSDIALYQAKNTGRNRVVVYDQ